MTTITIDMYSGVPNPTFDLTPEQEEVLEKVLSSRSEQKTLQQPPPNIGVLGYRGFSVSSPKGETAFQNLLVMDGIIHVAAGEEALNFIDMDRDIELMLLEFAKPYLDKEQTLHIKEVIQKNSSGGDATGLKNNSLKYAPPLDVAKWNDRNVMFRNNCYNYACDIITNTLAQPGRGSGQEAPDPPSCQEVGSAIQRDGLLSASHFTLNPTRGHYVALVIWPGQDFHFFRLDKNEKWSHKLGAYPVSTTDYGGHSITDPKACNRGPYTNWCGYYLCIPIYVTID